ncbi:MULTISPECIES: hypothetical protein [unclassified Streptomyces]|uniref:hypothetical protein n=1 Tax=unclassified Streptomyces TaxID=2593676 RepID=UPI0016603C98|nr:MULTISPECIES: hypothetical protein [unclassified Streptomyces]MBD0710594.1 hypothetical protein [Streptomyces sp. CBMA291]MBD0715441.1 hypothetical protein [Streptomyces sp. CBMA370]
MLKKATQALGTIGLVAATTLGVGGTAGTAQAATADVCYKPHVQNVGWKLEQCNGQWAGSIGEGRNLEALRVTVSAGKVCLRAHRSGYGWDSTYQCAEPGHAAEIGTTGMNAAIEAISFYHCGSGYFGAQGHLRNVGTVNSGPSPLHTYRPGCDAEEIIGTTGQGIPMEAVRLYWM